MQPVIVVAVCFLAVITVLAVWYGWYCSRASDDWRDQTEHIRELFRQEVVRRVAAEKAVQELKLFVNMYIPTAPTDIVDTDRPHSIASLLKEEESREVPALARKGRHSA